MDTMLEAIEKFKVQCAGLEDMELEPVLELLDNMQEVFLELLGTEPKKAKKTEHQLWKAKFKELSNLISKVEDRERILYEAKYPKLRYYCQLVDQEHSEEGWVKLKKEIDKWLNASAPWVAEEFEQLGYQEMLESCCEGLSFEEEPEAATELWKYSPIPCFRKYLPLVYAVDELWDSFQLYVRSEFPDKDEDFFAFHRSREAMAVWSDVIENMGSGMPISIFAAAAYLILRYKELGHDPDRELDALGQN